MSERTVQDGDYDVYPRDRWIDYDHLDRLGPEAEAVAGEVAQGEAVDPGEVLHIYLPLARWLVARAGGDRDGLHPNPPGRRQPTTTIIGITGSVAAGKTTTARVLTGLLRRGPGRPAVDLLTTDGFLYPNVVLEQRGLIDRKGFPETYDQDALVAALDAIRSGRAEVAVPVYSHRAYDIVPGEVQRIRRPDLLVVEGLTVLQGGSGPGERGLEGRVDLAVYVDADEQSVAAWHTERLMALRNGDAAESSDFLAWFTSISDAEARQVAASSWSEINLVNLRDHVAPTRARADVILEKGDDHRVRRVLVRRRGQGPARAGPARSGSPAGRPRPG